MAKLAGKRARMTRKAAKAEPKRAEERKQIADLQRQLEEAQAKLMAFRIYLEARSWGAALGAIAESEPDVVAIVSAHDKYVTESTQAQLAAMREALDKIADPANPGNVTMCDCEHDTEDCCTNVDYYCPQCIAGKALANSSTAADSPTVETTTQL